MFFQKVFFFAQLSWGLFLILFKWRIVGGLCTVSESETHFSALANNEENEIVDLLEMTYEYDK